MAPPFKRRKVVAGPRPAELTFDPTARSEYLTGFHKRKQARIKHAREAAVKKEKEEKVVERRQLREQRKKDLEEHVSAVNEELQKQMDVVDNANAEDEGDGELAAAEHAGDAVNGHTAVAEDVEAEEEYVDEDKYTTVTVEAMGDSNSDEDEDNGETDATAVAMDEKGDLLSTKGKSTAKGRPWAKDEQDRPKVRKKKFRYETKAERFATRAKQKAKNKRQAQARRNET